MSIEPPFTNRFRCKPGPDYKQCVGATKAGKQCRACASKGQDTCPQHAPFTKQLNNVKIEADTSMGGMITIYQDSAIISIPTKDAEALAKALLQADQWIKDQK